MIGPGQLHRGPYILTDYVFYYTFLTFIERVSSADKWGPLPMAGLKAAYAIKNQIEWSSLHGYYIRYTPRFSVFRNLEIRYWVIYPLPYPAGYSCSFWDL